MKHLLEHDTLGRLNLPKVIPPPTRKTYLQIIKDGLITLIEQKDEDSGLHFRDFSLQSLIDSENVQLLNPVGSINNTKLNVSDDVHNTISHLENMTNHLDSLTNDKLLNV